MHNAGQEDEQREDIEPWLMQPRSEATEERGDHGAEQYGKVRTEHGRYIAVHSLKDYDSEEEDDETEDDYNRKSSRESTLQLSSITYASIPSARVGDDLLERPDKHYRGTTKGAMQRNQIETDPKSPSQNASTQANVPQAVLRIVEENPLFHPPAIEIYSGLPISLRHFSSLRHWMTAQCSLYYKVLCSTIVSLARFVKPTPQILLDSSKTRVRKYV
jgi:hypothetical protein